MCITDPSHLYSVYVNSSATQYYSNRDAQGGHFPPKSNDDSLPCLLPISLFYASRVLALLPWRMRSSYALHPGLYLHVAVVWHVTMFSFQPFSLILSTIGWILGNAPSPLNHYLTQYSVIFPHILTYVICMFEYNTTVLVTGTFVIDHKETSSCLIPNNYVIN